MVVASPVAGGAHLAERMSHRVVPVDAIAQPGDATCGHVQLEREQTAGRPGGAEQEPPAVPAHGDAHDPGREVEEAGEPFQVEWPRDRSVAPGEEVDRRSADERPGRRQLDRGKAVGIDLAMGRERRAVVGGEVLPYQRMVDRRRPLDPRVAPSRSSGGGRAARCRREPCCGVSHPADERLAPRDVRGWLDRHRPRLGRGASTLPTDRLAAVSADDQIFEVDDRAELVEASEGQRVCLCISGNNRYRGGRPARDSPAHRADLNRRLGLVYLSGAEEWSRIIEGRGLTSRRAARGAQPPSGPTARPPRRAGPLDAIAYRGGRRSWRLPSQPDPSCLAGRAATPQGPQGLATRR